MLRLLSFYLAFFTLLCVPLQLANADPFGITTCLPISDAEWEELLSNPRLATKIDDITRIRAERSGLTDRQCAEFLNAITGAAEVIASFRRTTAGVVQGYRNGRDFLTQKGTYMTAKKLEELRGTDTLFKGIDPAELSRVPGLAHGQAQAIANNFFKTVRDERRLAIDLDAALWKRIPRFKPTGETEYTRGKMIEIEVHNTQIEKLTGGNGDLPDYAREALRNLSPSEVEAFNNPANREQWSKLASYHKLTPARAFWLGVARPTLDLKVASLGNDNIKDHPELAKAFDEGKKFAAREGINQYSQLEIVLKYGKESIVIDGSTISRETFADALVNQTNGRTLTGRVGPVRPPRQRVLTTLGMATLFAHGLDNLYVVYDGINAGNADLHGDFCPEPYCNDDESLAKELTTKWSTVGILERLRSAGGWRRDQQETGK